MRAFLVLILALAFPLSSAAQHPSPSHEPAPLLQSQDEQTLLGRAVRHGGYGGLFFGMTQVNGELVYLRGTRGAWVINMTENHAINLGIGRYRTGTDFAPTAWTVDDLATPEMRTNYGGFEVEYTNRSWRLVHVSAQALVGSGRVRFTDRDLPLDRTSDNYFVLQPGINLNVNITSWFRLSGGLLYRHVSAVNLEGTSNADLSGVSTYALLRFGSF